MIGAIIHNRYRLDAELGRGGMGTVYRAHDTLLDRDVAVKMLTADALGTEGRARLLREAQAVAQLDHPNIVAVYDAGETEGPSTGSGQALPFIVMQLVEGESLHVQRQQTIPEIIAVARQICAALDHVHAHGVVHRDLKPENDRLYGWESSRCWLAAVWLRQGRLADSRRVLAGAREKAGPKPNRPDEAFLALAEARLAAAENRWPEALAAFEVTAKLEARMGTRWHRAQALREWAEAHLKRNETGDADSAHRLLHEALAEYEAMNVPKYAAIVKERLQNQNE